MNNRIKELAEQASNQVFGHTNRNEFFEQKFAELIVKECALAGLETHGNYDVHDDILKHFGVEE